MTPRIPPRRRQPILFAHRGGAAHAPENTLKAFNTGLKLGANGLESDIWLSKDNQAILIHDEHIGSLPRRRKVADTLAVDLPDHVPTLRDLYTSVGTDFEFAVDIKSADAIDATVNTLREVSEVTGDDVVAKTWLCHPDLETLTSWRKRWSDVRLVHSTRVARLPGTPERHAAELHDRQIDAVNFRQGDWSGGLVVLYHRFDVYCFGWDAHLERVASELLNMGCDAIFSDHVDRMRSAHDRVYG